MKKRTYIVLAFFLLVIAGIKAQEARSQNANIEILADETTSFYDVGGAESNYGDNKHSVYTIRTKNRKSPYVSFTSFSTEKAFDIMYIYDGESSSAKLIGAYSGGNNPGIVQASGNALTIVFTSDGSGNFAGWSAVVGSGALVTKGTLPSVTSASNCADADPFCTGTTYTFPASTNVTSQTGPDYGCLLTQPNPVWYYLQIANSGNLVLSIAGSGGADVDFICWGPFTSPATACTGISSSGSIVDCSYSTSATETCTIPSGVTGQYYMILITNYANVSQNIVFNQVGGSGSTNCSIVGGCTVTANNTGPYCPGQTISLSSSNVTGATYSWSGPGGFTSTAQNPTRPGATTAMGGTYTVTATAGTSTCVATTAVTVNAAPTITVNSSTICPGASATLTAGGASTYTWSPATGLSATTGVSVTANPAVTTTYTITGTSVSGCTATATSTVTIGGSLTPTVNSPSICVGGSTTLTAGGATTYTWSPATGLSATTGASVTANPVSTTTYTVTGASGACTGTVTSVVTVNPLPTVTVNSATICPGSSTTLTAGGATTYSWSPATGLSATSGISVTANPAVTTTYTIVGTTGTCTSSATSTVTVNPTPTVTVNSATICPGSSTVLTAGGASTYAWSPATGLSATTGASVTANPVITTVYTITGTSVGGCTATATSTLTIGGSITPTVNSATICAGSSATLTAAGATTYTWSPATGLSATNGASVTANPATTTTYTITGASGACTGTVSSVVTVNPLPTVTVNAATICIGSSTTLTAGGATTYSWSPATGLSSTTGASVTANPSTTTTYTVLGTTATCTAQATSLVTVNPLPTVTANAGTICGGSSATLTGAGASTYTWSPATGLSSTTGTSVTASPVSTTNYTITGTDVNGCVNVGTTTVTIVTNPTVTVNTATICLGQQTATLTAAGATTYTWSPATGLSSTSGTSVTANPATTTTYTITGASGTCTSVATTIVTVNTLPVVTVNTGTICIGQQTATLNAGGASTYSWAPSTGLSSTIGASVTGNPTTTSSYTVTGTDINGCVNTATTAVTVNPLPTITVNSATICPTFSATLNAGGASSYTWNTGSNGSSLTAAPATTTAYTVVGADANGCISGNTATITVNATLLVSAGNNSPICQGSNLNLTSSIGVSWSWTGPGGYTSTSQNPTIVNATAAMSGTYSVTATDANGCQGNATTNVTVNPLPAVTIGSNGPVCVNQTLNLNSGGATNYTWSGPNGFNSAQQNPSIAGVTLAANGMYSVTGTDVNGCVNTATVNIVINPLPIVTTSGSTVCINATVNLSATGGTAYSWNGPNGFTSNQQSPTIANATPAANGVYVVVVTDANGCTNGSNAQVVVNPIPTIVATSANICQGSTATLNASGANSYAWLPTSGLSSATSATVMASPGATTVYTVTGTDINGCQGTTTLTVLVTPAPLVAIGPATISGCAPVCVSFSNSASGTGTCSWNFGNGTSSTSCSPTNCFTTQGSYSVTLTITDNSGCVGTSSANVTVYPMPHADFNATPQPTTILDNNIHFYDASSNATITTWGWNLGNGITTTIQNPSCLYGDTGSYTTQLVVTSNHGCKDSTTKIIRIDDDYSLYVPNAFSPNDDGVNDIFYAKGEGVRDFKMYIFDRWGSQVFYSEDIYKGWNGHYQSKGGEVLQEDVYVWKIECKTVKGEKKQLSGHVS